MKLLKILFTLTLIIAFINTTLARDINEIRKSGKIYIGFDKSEIGSINYEMAYEFANYMDLELIEVIVDWQELFSKDGVIPENIETDKTLNYTPDAFNKIDLYCGNISPMEWRKRLFDFAPTLISAEVIVVNNNMENKPVETKDLAGLKIGMMKGTSFVSHMESINNKIGGGIIFVKTETSEIAKQKLVNGEIDGIILDAPEALNFIVNQNNKFKIQLPIDKTSSLIWAVEHNNALKDEVNKFMVYIQSNNILDKLFTNRYSIKYSDFEELLTSHNPVKKYHRDLDQILKDKKIIISLRERDFVYHKQGDSKQFMHILAEEFASYLGVELEYVVVPSFNNYWQNTDGEIVKDSSYTPEMFNYFDLACDIFAPLPWRTNKVNLIPVYTTNYDVIAKKSTKINSFTDLNKYKCATAENTMYHELLSKLNINNFYFTKINNMVSSVENGDADYTLIYNSFLYPKLETKISLGTTDITWAVRNDQPKLKKALEKFIQESTKNGLLNTLNKISKGNNITNIEEFLKDYYYSEQIGTLPHITVDAEKGLPQEDVYSILQDDKGYLWFGTLYGVVKYNGKLMKQFNTNNGLINNSVNDIANNNNGDIIIATDHGLSFINGNEIKNHPHSSAINKIYIDYKNKIWVICNNGIYKFNAGKFSKVKSIDISVTGKINSFQQDTTNTRYIIAAKKGLFNYSDNKLTKVLTDEIYYAFIDKDNTLWYASPNGIFYECIDLVCEIKNAIKINQQIQVPETKIVKISQSKNGSIWLQNTHNLYQVNSSDQKAIVYKTGNDLINNIILSFIEDREQNIWIGYKGGLQKIINNKSLRNFMPKDLDYYVSSVQIDDLKNIWISTNNGVFIYNKELKELHSIKEINRFSIVKKLSNGNIIFITDKEIYLFDYTTKKMIAKTNHKLNGLKAVFVSSKDEIFISTGKLGILYYLDKWNSEPIIINNEKTNLITEIIEQNENIYISNMNKVYSFKKMKLSLYAELPSTISSIGGTIDEIWVSVKGKLYSLNDTLNSYILNDKDLIIKDIIPSRSHSHIWLSTNKGVFYFNTVNKEIIFNISNKDGLQGNEIVDNGLYIDKQGILWISTYHGLSNFNIKSNKQVKYSPRCYLNSVLVNGEKINMNEDNTFKYNKNNILFQLSGLFFSNENSVEYEYYLRGSQNDFEFIRRTKENKIYYNNLAPGEYTLVYRARGEDNIWSESKSFSFVVNKAIWNTWTFRILTVLFILLILYLIYKWRIRRVHQQKIHLEKIVKERTLDLMDANQIITTKNEEITASIQYAERIQNSILPDKYLLENINDFFILFKPLNVVSGDFYWAAKTENSTIITAADCTGHGVPGAFMSMLGISYLREIVIKSNITKPSEILFELRQEIINTLQQTGEAGTQKDGMDMALISINHKNNTVQFAGANNPLYIIRPKENEKYKLNENCIFALDNEKFVLYEIKPDKMPIAIYEKMDAYTNHEIKLEDGDQIYMFSDGYADQFGGIKGKKLKYKPFKSMLLQNANKPMSEQKEILNSAFEDWKHSDTYSYDQIDDVVLIGIKI